MPQVIISRLAYADIDRIYTFLTEHNAQQQANNVVSLLKGAFTKLETLPQSGRRYTLTLNGNTLDNVRESKIRYGKGGYSFLHHYNKAQDLVIILAIKHHREQHYQ